MNRVRCGAGGRRWVRCPRDEKIDRWRVIACRNKRGIETVCMWRAKGAMVHGRAVLSRGVIAKRYHRWKSGVAILGNGFTPAASYQVKSFPMRRGRAHGLLHR